MCSAAAYATPIRDIGIQIEGSSTGKLLFCKAVARFTIIQTLERDDVSVVLIIVVVAPNAHLRQLASTYIVLEAQSEQGAEPDRRLIWLVCEEATSVLAQWDDPGRPTVRPRPNLSRASSTFELAAELALYYICNRRGMGANA